MKICTVLSTIGLLFIFNACDPNKGKTTPTLSPYITEVFEYQYGPGQHAGQASSENNFVGESNSYVLLGGWGGYIIGGFDHDIQNISGQDFIIFCKGSTAPEPAIVYVMEDTNKDLRPNDTWYEIKGSEYNNSETIHNYSVTYKKPLPNENITWSDNQGNNGELIPQYGNETSDTWWSSNITANELTLTGTKLPDAYMQDPANAAFWIPKPDLFQYGYAENATGYDYDSSLIGNRFDISDAIDENGNPVSLKNIRFIKIQSSVFQIAGWFNEISTEINGAADISLIKN